MCVCGARRRRRRRRAAKALRARGHHVPALARGLRRQPRLGLELGGILVSLRAPRLIDVRSSIGVARIFSALLSVCSQRMNRFVWCFTSLFSVTHARSSLAYSTHFLSYVNKPSAGLW